MPAAARANMDMVKQDAPHCHATIHPPAPTPAPVPHPAMPLMILGGAPTVLIDNMPAAQATNQTLPCVLATCVPAGPGMILKGSMTVMIGGLPAARADDPTLHSSCVAPIPSPVGKVMPPCSATVMIGG